MAQKKRQRKTNEIPQALTIGELAARAGCHAHQAVYFIRSNSIQPVSHVARYRIFSDETLVRLKAHLVNLTKRKRAV